MWTNIAFAAFLMVVSGVLLATHNRSWRQAQSEDHDDKATDFHWRRYRRRMQASAMIGIVGLTVGIGAWIEDTLLSAIYWSVVFLIVVWIVILAAADLVSSRFFLNQIRDQHTAEHAALQAELDRIRSRESNGRSERE